MVLEGVLKEKVDNLVKLHFDLYYRLINASKWEKEAKELEEKANRIQQELGFLKIATGKSIKSKEKAIKLESEHRKITDKMGAIRKTLNEIPVIADVIKKMTEGDDRFLKTLQFAIDNPKKVYKETNQYLKKHKGRKK